MAEESDKNNFRLDYRENPELLAALGGKEPGDECEIRLKLTVLENNVDEALTSTIRNIIVEDYDSKEEVKATPSEAEPVMAVMMKRGGMKHNEDGE